MADRRQRMLAALACATLALAVAAGGGATTPPGEQAVDVHVVATALPHPAGTARVLVRSAGIRVPRAAADPEQRVVLRDDVLVYREPPSAGVRAGSSLVAVDVRTARVLWRSRAADDPPPTAVPPLLYAGMLPSGDGTIALDVRSGRVVWSVPRLHVLGAAGGLLFGTIGRTFIAVRPATGARLWAAELSGGSYSAPQVVGPNVLMHDGYDGGAMIVQALRALDLRTGKERWRDTRSWGSIIAVRGQRIYELIADPADLDSYKPATVHWFDTQTGHGESIDYAPDPQKNWHGTNPATHDAKISGKYVYVGVQGTVYRYDLDRPAASAHATRIAQGPTSTFSFHGDDAWRVNEDRRVEVLAMRDPSVAMRSVLDDVPRGVTLFRVDGDIAYAAVPRRGVWVIDLAAKRAVSMAPGACARFTAVERTAASLFVTCEDANGASLARFAR
jgi:hypothetical protein